MNPQTESLKKELEDTQEALRRSRNMVKMLQSNMSVSIESMALSLKRFYNSNQDALFTNEVDRDWWMMQVILILQAQPYSEVW